MNSTCKKYGHIPNPGYGHHANPINAGQGYFRINRNWSETDGMGVVHVNLDTECERCGEKYQIGKLHLTPQDKPVDGFAVQGFHDLALKLAEHHKRTCDGASCTISLYEIQRMAEAAGVRFTAKEKKEFF